MTEPRLKTEIRVAAQIRRAQAGGAFAVVARRGDADAGAVAVKVYLGGGRARALVQSRDLDGRAIWRDPLAGTDTGAEIGARTGSGIGSGIVSGTGFENSAGAKRAGDPPKDYPEADVDARLAREASIDPDLWIVEIEDSRGRAFVEDA